jgi:hypothetical protein
VQCRIQESDGEHTGTPKDSGNALHTAVAKKVPENIPTGTLSQLDVLSRLPILHVKQDVPVTETGLRMRLQHGHLTIQ